MAVPLEFDSPFAVAGLPPADSAVMRQALIVAPNRFAVTAAKPPTLQSGQEVLIRTAACGICSGDLMPWYLEKKIGTVLGHEVVGWAMEVGQGVEHIRPGDLVFLHHHAPCHHCPECARGAYVHCSTWKSSKLDPGGMAERIRLPAEIVQGDAFAVNDLTVDQAVFLEPLACSVKALQKIPNLPGASGTVVGCGVMGLLNLATARALGAGHLTAVEPDAHRRQLARDFGAASAWTPEQAAENLKAKVDFVIIGPGHSEVIRQSLAYLRPGGTAILFTPTPTGVLTPLDLGDLYFREISLVPSYSCGPEETRLAYELLRKGQVRPESLITHRFPLAEVQQAYETARAGGRAMKVLVTFETEKSP